MKTLFRIVITAVFGLLLCGIPPRKGLFWGISPVKFVDRAKVVQAKSFTPFGETFYVSVEANKTVSGFISSLLSSCRPSYIALNVALGVADSIQGHAFGTVPEFSVESLEGPKLLADPHPSVRLRFSHGVSAPIYHTGPSSMSRCARFAMCCGHGPSNRAKVAAARLIWSTGSQAGQCNYGHCSAIAFSLPGAKTISAGVDAIRGTLNHEQSAESLAGDIKKTRHV